MIWRSRVTLARSARMLAALAAVLTLTAAHAPPNPYREVPNWAKLPEGEMWGHVFGVGVDSHGNVWVLERCGGSSCVGSNAPSIREFDSTGRYLKSMGEGVF